MAGTTGKRAVNCGNYQQLYDYVAMGLRDLDEGEIPLLFEEDDGGEFADNPAALNEADLLLLETLRGRR